MGDREPAEDVLGSGGQTRAWIAVGIMTILAIILGGGVLNLWAQVNDTTTEPGTSNAAVESVGVESPGHDPSPTSTDQDAFAEPMGDPPAPFEVEVRGEEGLGRLATFIEDQGIDDKTARRLTKLYEESYADLADLETRKEAGTLDEATHAQQEGDELTRRSETVVDLLGPERSHSLHRRLLVP
jgi:hypothetical protein